MTDRPDVPEGFAPFPFTTGFVGVNGPLYARRDREGRIRLGFRVEERHCNPMRIAHGGMLVTFADMQLPFGARFQADLADRFLPTIHLATDFLAPAPLGAWVEGETEVLRRTRNLVFAQCLVTADSEPCLRASGIFKIGPEAKLDDPALAALFKGTDAAGT